jgi:uncharacterized protein YrrD
MLIKSKALKGYKLHARDGEIGKVVDFYFDDKFWTLRYLVANTGAWLKNRKVLISPHAFDKIEKKERLFSLKLSKKQIKESPPLENDQPVSKQYQQAYMGYYGYPIYWYGSYPWGASPVINPSEVAQTQKENNWDPHLRSAHEVAGYKIHARDGEIGNVQDFIIDDKTFTIRYLVVEAGSWFSDKKVLVSPHWIDQIDSIHSQVFTSLSREQVKNSPLYLENRRVGRKYEADLHDHYGYDGYWDEGSPPLTHSSSLHGARSADLPDSKSHGL